MLRKWEKKAIRYTVGFSALFILIYPVARYFILPLYVKIWPYKAVILYAIFAIVIVYLVLRPKFVRRLKGGDQKG